MNTKITALTLAAATAFAFTPKPASASNDGAVIAGAIIGGLIAGAVIANANDNCAPVYTTSSYCPPAPVYTTDGYWTTTTVNVWVPGVWVVERDYRGFNNRRYVAGHYECRNNRTWVAYGPRNPRPVYHTAGGYGHDRRDDRRDDRHDNRRDDRRDDHRGNRR